MDRGRAGLGPVLTMHSDARRNAGRDPVKDAAIIALKRILDPLLDLMFDAGVTVQELNNLARDSAVQMGTKRAVREGGRPSKSRVAIMTGLPRSEVTRIMNSCDSISQAKPRYSPARRVLAAWHDDSRFLAPDGTPAELPIFGKRRSFEKLVERYGGGIPVRAMLDELVQLESVERMDGQRLKAKARFPISTGLTDRSVAALGERARDLLETLIHNLRRRSRPHFEATALLEAGDVDIVTLVRREIAEQGTNFINAANALLTRSQKRRNPKATTSPSRGTCRFGVTVYYFQDELPDEEHAVGLIPVNRRKNLRRQMPKPQKPIPSQLPK
jgi:hypothetical protein